MLKLLKRIMQEVNEAKGLEDVLRIIVLRVKSAMDTQACSIYLLNHTTSEYTLMATDGLRPSAVGRVNLPNYRGLIGLVGRREEAINLDNAPKHQEFYYHPDASEERYQGFLGVPIIHQRKLLGVITVQNEDSGRFDEAEEAFLITVSAQLAAVIAHAESSGLITNLLASDSSSNELPTDEATVRGNPCVPGVGIGYAVTIYPVSDLEAVPDKEIENHALEIVKFEEAISTVKEDIKTLKERLPAHLPKHEKALFDAYLGILNSASLSAEVIAEIQLGNWAQGALRRVIRRHVAQFEAIEDEYLRERAADFRDLGRRILMHLQASQHIQFDESQKVILVGEEIAASNLIEVPEGNLVGIISAKGSANSHAAILARSMAIPTVMGVNGLPVQHMDGCQVIVDGYYGHVYISPSEELLSEFQQLVAEEQELDANLEEIRDAPSQTRDGHRLALFVNAGLSGDASLSLSAGAEGVGLYRTEIPFLVHDRFPAEEEQRLIYRDLLAAFSPRSVVMRTLDIGGDKSLPYFAIQEENPFLGWRGIRVMLDHPELFLAQLRAMLAASEGLDNLKIMLPMISGVEEVDDALRLIDQAYQELQQDGVQVMKPAVGIMIETPSAIYQIRQLAKRVDFLSVGSNDLTQYLLAVDRNNARVSSIYDSLHPAVISALAQIVEGAHQEGKPISICGEMAADPAAVVLLLGLGFDSLSVNAVSLLRTKWVIRRFSMQEAQEILREVSAMEDGSVIRFHLEQALEQRGLGGLIRAGL